MSIVAGLAVTGMVVAVSATGCSSNKSSTASSSAASSAATTTTSSSAAAQPGDYTGLLIKPTDITAPTDTFTSQPPTQNPNGKPGVAVVFANQNGTHQIGDTVLILPDPASAAGALEAAKAALGNSVTGGTPQPAPVGTDGTKSVAVLLFTEGKAFTTLEFDSGPNEVAPPDFVTDVGQKQDAAIKNGLPS